MTTLDQSTLQKKTFDKHQDLVVQKEGLGLV